MMRKVQEVVMGWLLIGTPLTGLEMLGLLVVMERVMYLTREMESTEEGDPQPPEKSRG